MMGTAVVTGASSGIGRATAIALAEAGYDVVACARRVDRLQDLASGHASVTAHALDVTDQGSVDALAADLADRDITLLVANAGGAFDAATIAEAEVESWQQAHEVNVIGTLRCVRAFLPQLDASGRGLLVLMGSTAGLIVYEGGGSYTAAKHAVHAMAQTLRLELSGQSVRVCEIAPGMVRTDEFAVNRFGGDAAKAAKVYEGVAQPLTAEDIARAVTWVATQPPHVNVDLMVLRPLAQAAQHKVHRVIDAD